MPWLLTIILVGKIGASPISPPTLDSQLPYISLWSYGDTPQVELITTKVESEAECYRIEHLWVKAFANLKAQQYPDCRPLESN